LNSRGCMRRARFFASLDMWHPFYALSSEGGCPPNRVNPRPGAVASSADSLLKLNDSSQPTTSPVPTPIKTALPETVAIDIKVKPSKATLTLDENPVAGNPVQATVPKDRLIHVVRASATGFVPFSEIVSFASDVHLNIELHRSRAQIRAGAKAHPRQAHARPKSSLNSWSQSEQLTEPGMNLGRPTKHRTSKRLDEGDPFTP